jgi:hypothetical protein
MGLFSKPLTEPIASVSNVIPRSGTTREIFPWEWPGPIAPPGMQAIKQAGNTFTHVTNTDPKYQSENATANDYKKLVAWAERMHWTSSMVAAHWGGLAGSTSGMLYTKANLIKLQEHIASKCREKYNQETGA